MCIEGQTIKEEKDIEELANCQYNNIAFWSQFNQDNLANTLMKFLLTKIYKIK